MEALSSGTFSPSICCRASSKSFCLRSSSAAAAAAAFVAAAASAAAAADSCSSSIMLLPSPLEKSMQPALKGMRGFILLLLLLLLQLLLQQLLQGRVSEKETSSRLRVSCCSVSLLIAAEMLLPPDKAKINSVKQLLLFVLRWQQQQRHRSSATCSCSRDSRAHAFSSKKPHTRPTLQTAASTVADKEPDSKLLNA